MTTIGADEWVAAAVRVGDLDLTDETETTEWINTTAELFDSVAWVSRQPSWLDNPDARVTLRTAVEAFRAEGQS